MFALLSFYPSQTGISPMGNIQKQLNNGEKHTFIHIYTHARAIFQNKIVPLHPNGHLQNRSKCGKYKQVK